MRDKNGNELFPLTLKEVGYKGSANFNLFAGGRCLQNGWKLHGDDKAIWITKGGEKLTFDIVATTNKGALYCAQIKRNQVSNDGEIDAVAHITMSEDHAHARLGHMSMAHT